MASTAKGSIMIIQAEIHIRAPLPIVWRVFSHLEEWKDWNTACSSCRFTSGEDLAEGACFTFVVKPVVFPVRVEPRVIGCNPRREVVWEGERFGIHAVHTWRFRETASGVVLNSVETFEGPMLLLGRLVGVPKRLHRLTAQMLNQIKRYAEACSTSDASQTQAA
jgi:hypothetical protein